MMVEDLRLLTIAEAAKVMDLGYNTVKGLVESGRLKTVNIGKQERISIVEIRRFVAGEGESDEVPE